MSKHVLTVIVGVVVGVSLLLYMFAFQVRQSEKAVLLRFGESIATPEAGYHFKWPWPIEDVRRFDSRIIVAEGKYEETPTRDHHNITMSLCAGWQVVDPLVFNQNFGRAPEKFVMQTAWNGLEGYVRGSALAVMGQHDLRDLVSVEKEKLQYDQIEEKILKSVNKDTENSYGVKFVLVKLRRLELPESATQKVYQRMIADRKKEAGAIQSASKAAASEIKGKADSESKEILALAEQAAQQIRGEGDAKAADSFKVFDKYPELAIYLRKLKSLQEVLKTNATVIVDTTMPPFDTMVTGAPEIRKPVTATAADGSADVSKKPRN